MVNAGIHDRGELAKAARLLLEAHHRDAPLLLANVWDVTSARIIEAAGFEFIATSSHAIADVLGETDGDSSNPRLVFDWTCLLYTSPSPRDRQKSRMPSS